MRSPAPTWGNKEAIPPGPTDAASDRLPPRLCNASAPRPSSQGPISDDAPSTCTHRFLPPQIQSEESADLTCAEVSLLRWAGDVNDLSPPPRPPQVPGEGGAALHGGGGPGGRRLMARPGPARVLPGPAVGRPHGAPQRHLPGGAARALHRAGWGPPPPSPPHPRALRQARTSFSPDLPRRTLKHQRVWHRCGDCTE